MSGSTQWPKVWEPYLIPFFVWCWLGLVWTCLLQTRLASLALVTPGFLILLHGIKSTKQFFQIVFSPTLEQIYAMSKNILPELVICLKPFPRLMDKFHLQQRVRKIPFASVIEADHECRKLQMEIERGRPDLFLCAIIFPIGAVYLC